MSETVNNAANGVQAMDVEESDTAPVQDATTMQVEDAEVEEEEDVSALLDLLDKVASLPQGKEQIPVLLEVIHYPQEEGSSGSKSIQLKERAIYDLTRAYCASQQYDQVVQFLTTASAGPENEDTTTTATTTTTTSTDVTTAAVETETTKAATPILQQLTKAKLAKVVRQVLDIVCRMAPVEVQEEVAQKIWQWTQREKRSFLRQRVEAKLINILFRRENYVQAQELCNSLLYELKQLDDKQLLVETHLLESKIQFGLRNIPKAKAALTASRTAANAIYVSPTLQAEIDSMSGTIHTEEGDYNTAHSYFLEAFEQLDQLSVNAEKSSAAAAAAASTATTSITTTTTTSTPVSLKNEAVLSLKYMMLCRILDSLRAALQISSTGTVGIKSNTKTEIDLSNMISSKQAIKYAGRDIEAMSSIAKAAANRDLHEYETVLQTYQTELQGDLLIQHHLHILQEQLLESNLIRIIEPYSCVELTHVASLMNMPVTAVERKLSQMILDSKFHGILDQGAGQLIVYEESAKDTAMEKGLQVIANMDSVVTSLFERSKALRTVMM